MLFLIIICQLFECVQVSYLAANSLFPEWKVWTQFLDDYTEGLSLDGLAESHPIEVILHALHFFSWYNLLKGISIITVFDNSSI